MRIRELDGLRGIAILAVIATHSLRWLPATGAQYGWLGVDLFFILSGFLITTILVNLRGSEQYFSIFYSRRALRIFPPYYLAVAIYLAVSVAAGRVGSLELWMRYIFYYSSLLPLRAAEMRSSPLLLLLPVHHGLAVLWSLSVEEIYYTIWAPVVRFTTQRVFTFILAGMIVAAPLLRWMLHTPEYPEVLVFYCRMDALAMGSLVALGVVARDRIGMESIWSDKVLGWAGAFTAVAAAVLFGWRHGDLSNVVLTTIGISLADVAFALFTYSVIRRAGSGEWWVRMLRARWLCSVGMVSYSLYLFHFPIFAMVQPWVDALRMSRRVSAVTEVIVGFTLSLLVAYAMWYLFESRILRWKDRHVPSGGRISSGVEVATEAVQA